MPTYDYLCDDCGAFSAIRPMSASAEPSECPGCGDAAPRAILSAPRMALMSGTARVAATTNERSRHAPMTNTDYVARHRPGCTCCTTARTSLVADAPKPAAKGFPGARPWMISH